MVKLSAINLKMNRLTDADHLRPSLHTHFESSPVQAKVFKVRMLCFYGPSNANTLIFQPIFLDFESQQGYMSIYGDIIYKISLHMFFETK